MSTPGRVWKFGDDPWQWVLAASMQGDYSGLPNTLAYWTGEWNGSQFVPAHADPAQRAPLRPANAGFRTSPETPARAARSSRSGR